MAIRLLAKEARNGQPGRWCQPDSALKKENKQGNERYFPPEITRKGVALKSAFAIIWVIVIAFYKLLSGTDVG